MKTRVCLGFLAVVATGGCHSAGGKLMVDSPALPYVKPDISDITGIDEDDDTDAAPAAAPAPAPTPAPAPATKPSGK